MIKANKIIIFLITFFLLVGLYWFFYKVESTEEKKEFTSIDGNLDIQELVEVGQLYFDGSSESGKSYNLETARQYYETAIRKDPKGHPLVWYQLGRIDFIEGKFNAAIYKFEKQREYFPDEEFSVDYMLGLVYGYKARRTGEQADWDEAAAAFTRFVEHEPNAPWGRVDLAWVYFAQGKFEEMKPVLAEGLLIEPNNAWLHNMYGLALMNTGDRAGAREHFGFAEVLAAQLTAEEWGKSYPGNDPGTWEQGLAEFRTAIQKNLALTAEEVE